eukprot:jgi/Picre1/32763/NNA_001049.t1
MLFLARARPHDALINVLLLVKFILSIASVKCTLHWIQTESVHIQQMWSLARASCLELADVLCTFHKKACEFLMFLLKRGDCIESEAANHVLRFAKPLHAVDRTKSVHCLARQIHQYSLNPCNPLEGLLPFSLVSPISEYSKIHSN